MPRGSVSSRAAKSSSAGTGCRSAAAVVTTTSGPTPARASPSAVARRVARSRDSTVMRSAEAANASRMSRPSGIASGRSSTPGAGDCPDASAKNAMSSASCSLVRTSAATTIQTGAGLLERRSASTAPRAGVATPVSLVRRVTALSDMKGHQERENRVPATRLLIDRVFERLACGGLLGRLLRAAAPRAEQAVMQVDMRLVFARVILAGNVFAGVTQRGVAVLRLDTFLKTALRIFIRADPPEPFMQRSVPRKHHLARLREIAVEENRADQRLQRILERSRPFAAAGHFLALPDTQVPG